MKHLYNSQGTIQEETLAKDDYGSDTSTWANVTGLVNFPCRINWTHGMARGERVVNEKVFWIRDAKVYCAYYSEINTKKKNSVSMRFVYNEVNYDIVDLGNVDEVGKYMVLNIKRSEI